MLVACWCLDDDERRARLVAELEDVHRAYLLAYAHWDGKKLDHERTQLLARLDTPDEALPDVADVIAAAHDYLDRAPRPAAPE